MVTNAKAKNDKLTAEAQAALAASANHDASVKATLENIKGFAEAAARGQASLTEAAIYFGMQCAAEAVLESDAERIYLGYAEAYNAARTHGTDAIAADAKSAKSAVSTFKSFGRATVARVSYELPGFYDTVVKVRAGMDAKSVNSAYQSMAAVNRATDAFLLKPDADGELDALANLKAFCGMFADDMADGEEWLRGVMAKKPKASLDALARLAKLVETLAKACDGDDADPVVSAGIGDQVTALSTAMADLVKREAAKVGKAKSLVETFRRVEGETNVLALIHRESKAA